MPQAGRYVAAWLAAFATLNMRKISVRQYQVHHACHEEDITLAATGSALSHFMPLASMRMQHCGRQ
jgi:hypothetical protein